MTTDPAVFQESIDERIAALTDVPVLAVFGRQLTDGERQRFERLADVQIEEWAKATASTWSIPVVSPPRSTSSSPTARTASQRA